MTYLYRVIAKYSDETIVKKDFSELWERDSFVRDELRIHETISFECYKIHPVTFLRVE